MMSNINDKLQYGFRYNFSVRSSKCFANIVQSTSGMDIPIGRNRIVRVTKKSQSPVVDTRIYQCFSPRAAWYACPSVDQARFAIDMSARLYFKITL